MVTRLLAEHFMVGLAVLLCFAVARRLEELRCIIRREAEQTPGETLVVTNKKVRCALTGEDRHERLRDPGEVEGATITHFGSIRGIDTFKDYQTVLIDGFSNWGLLHFAHDIQCHLSHRVPR